MAAMDTNTPSVATHEIRAGRRHMRRNWLLAMPAVLLVLIGASGPLLIVLVCSFLEPGDYGVTWKPTLDAWFQTFFSIDTADGTVHLADAHLSIFWRSVKLALLTVLIAFMFGIPTALFIATRPKTQRALWLFLITIPFWSSLLIRTFAIMEAIRDEGVVNTWAVYSGIIDAPMRMLHSEGAILFGMAYVYLPLMVLPLYAALERLDFRLLEAGYDLYANRWQVFRRIVLPLIRPGIVAGAVLVFVPSLGAYVTPHVLGGNEQMMIGNFIELQFGQGQNWPLGAALSMLLLIAVAIVLLVYGRAAFRERSHD